MGKPVAFWGGKGVFGFGFSCSSVVDDFLTIFGSSEKASLWGLI